MDLAANQLPQEGKYLRSNFIVIRQYLRKRKALVLEMSAHLVLLVPLARISLCKMLMGQCEQAEAIQLMLRHLYLTSITIKNSNYARVSFKPLYDINTICYR